ncbi:MAG: dipicolinate synthase subunit DpsA [Provencibacterium sp.]|jgi:dipicolinate synthase subunit A|nr:dipicolinate synthase subunit DpsA [Provencibacterium sp.]
MGEERTIAVFGGDLRQCCLCNLLAQDGNKVYALYFDQCEELDGRVLRTEPAWTPPCSVYIFPLPVSSDGERLNAPFCPMPPPVEECLGYIHPGARVLGGMLGPRIQRWAHEKGIAAADYYEREELTVLNCIPTAEGALEIAMQETARTIFGARALVAGFGRVGKAMTRLLLACGAKVTVAARKQEDLAWIRMQGAQAAPMQNLAEAAAEADLIFNTAPACLFGREVLGRLPKDCLLIDLSSKPGGVDFEAAKALGVRVIWALSLPGKVAPVTAAEIIRDTVYNILHEQG